jgi:hypothetical protein
MQLLRSTVCIGLLCVVLFHAHPALALSMENKQKLQQAIADLAGEKNQNLRVQPDYAAISGPEMAVVLLKREGGSDELRVLRVTGDGGVATWFTLPMTTAGLSGQKPFLLLMGGRHLLTYSTIERTDAMGLAHEVGDLAVYDLTAAGGPHSVFALDNIEDLRYQTTDDKAYTSLLRQPSQHFLNHSGKLPIKFDYYLLGFDPDLGQYTLSHHLQLVTGARTDEAVNLNNRALAHYYSGRLLEASRDLERATQESESGQSMMLRNQSFVKGEIDDLSNQVRKAPQAEGDEALMDFWQGDFAAALRLLEGRQRGGLSAAELALLGLSLANQRRWPEADKVTAALGGHKYASIGDYLYELTKIAEYQGVSPAFAVQIKALEHFDPGHPGLYAAMSRVLRHANKPLDAEALVLQALGRARATNRDTLPLELELYDLAGQGNDSATQDELCRKALQSHGGNLHRFVALADYLDFTNVYVEVEPAERNDRIKAPKERLDYVGEAPPGFSP